MAIEIEQRAPPLARSGPAQVGTWLPRLAPVAVAIPPAVLTLVCVIGWKFNGLYGQDPFAYFDYGVGPLRRFLMSGAALPAMVWPLGYPSLVALASLVLGTSTVAGQTVSLLAGAAAAMLTYLFGRDLLILAGARRPAARRVAVIGSLLFGVTGWTVESSALITADSTAVAASLLSAWALARWCAADAGWRSDGWIALAGAALAWSLISRWAELALVPVWLLAMAPAIRAKGRHAFRALWALAPAGVILGCQISLILTVPSDPQLGGWPFAGNLGLVSGGGWSVVHLFQRDFFNPDGSWHYQLPNALFYATAPFRPIYLTPLFVAPAVVGAWLVLSRYRLAIAWLLGWPAAMLVLDAGLAEQNIRFVLAALPPIALLAGLGVSVIWEYLRPQDRPIAVLFLIASLAAVAAAGMYDVHKVVLASRDDASVASWAAHEIPAHATTVAFGITLTLSHDTRLDPLDLSTVSDADLRRLARTRPAFLLVGVSTMTGQLAGRPTGEHFRYLRDVIGMSVVGGKLAYTLFKIHTT